MGSVGSLRSWDSELPSPPTRAGSRQLTPLHLVSFQVKPKTYSRSQDRLADDIVYRGIRYVNPRDFLDDLRAADLSHSFQEGQFPNGATAIPSPTAGNVGLADLRANGAHCRGSRAFRGSRSSSQEEAEEEVERGRR